MRNAACTIAACVALAMPDSARAADLQPLIKRALERGVTYLKGKQTRAGAWESHHAMGGTALVALTLLECDLPGDDPVVQLAAGQIRQGSVSLDYTYGLSLSIMFLDRLGDPADIPLIESMTVRLLAGQSQRGGWTYHCPAPVADEVRRLTALVQRDKVEKRPVERRRRDKPRERRRLSKEIEDQLKSLAQQAPAGANDDNSNTQFATLALWISSRYDIPVDGALAKVDARFRLSQNADGGWGYVAGDAQPNSTSSMTCAGLLGLAVGQGVRKMAEEEAKLLPANRKAKAHDLSKDPVVRAGLQALGTVVGVPLGAIPPQALGQSPHFDYYFLWSLERVGVAYGLETIGKKDWFRWGAELLLAAQTTDGGWGNEIDTSFALLFLRRANLAEDLTSTLKGTVGDPGEISLRAGGVGGAAVRRVLLKPGNNPHARAMRGGNDAKRDAASGSTAAAGPLPVDVAPLVAAVVNAPEKQQTELLARYQESKGVLYTQALAATIHRVEGRSKTAARDALRDRLYRMSAETLRDKLQDEDLEVRSAAALACGMKKENPFVPDLIARLDDDERRVVRAAVVALKSITNQDFGPTPTATADEHARAVAAWKAWWKKQSP